MTPTEFAKGMGILSVAYQGFKDFQVDQMTIEIWYTFFEDVRADVFISAIKSYIRGSKFPPKINDLLEKCEEMKVTIRNETLQLMYDKGYFHKGIIDGEEVRLTDGHAFRNYEKANRWLERGIEPKWLREDIARYYQNQLEYKNQALQIKGELL